MFSVIAIYLAPFKVIRYIMPVFPLIILIIPLTISAIGINFLKIGLSSILMILFAWNAFNVEKINYLYENKLNAAAIVFREVGKDYAVPLGVWQIRENVRAALKEKPLES